jgi:hypothetical protein
MAAGGDLDHAQRIVHSVDHLSHDVPAVACLAEFVAAGDVDGAVRIACSIANVNQRTRALARVSQARARAGDLDGAERVAHDIANTDHRAEALAYLAKAAAGDPDRAERIARTITDQDRQAKTLLTLTRGRSRRHRLRAVADALRITDWHVSAQDVLELAPPTALVAILAELDAVHATRLNGP